MGPRIGILGGGQLGKMLYSAGMQLDMNLAFMDLDDSFPVASCTKHYNNGDFTKYDDVMLFGKDKDVLTIEIERVNVDALSALEYHGVKVYPQPKILRTIQDKGLQKEFYMSQNIPTASFKLYDNIQQLRQDLRENKLAYPFIQKTRKDGYDGRGVKVIKSEKDLKTAFVVDFLTEEMIDIEREIAIICCRNRDGDLVTYDAVEMVFHPDENILLYQLAPARVHPKRLEEAKELARRITQSLQIVGVLAIEMFFTTDGEVIVNEMAPRPHNSGHHTIECCHCSQYENHLRAICGLPLGSTALLSKSLLMNVLGSPKHTGPVIYSGIEKVLSIPGVNLHLYGKKETRPYRKMGHINIVGDSRDGLIKLNEKIQEDFSVITANK